MTVNTEVDLDTQQWREYLSVQVCIERRGVDRMVDRWIVMGFGSLDDAVRTQQHHGVGAATVLNVWGTRYFDVDPDHCRDCERAGGGSLHYLNCPRYRR